jgi:hypothetical protein
MAIKAWGPVFGLLGLLSLSGTGLFMEYSKPNNHGQPPRT